jgi:5'-phosphate synthase pdxT subunit
MSDPELVAGIIAAVTIPVMAKARIGHFVEAQVLEALGVDYVDESEVLTPADEEHPIDKHAFKVPFVCGCRDLGEALRRVGTEPLEVRRPAQLQDLDGLIIPGGESTTIGKLLLEWGLLDPLRERIACGLPVWGTCAGAILLANEVRDALPGHPLLGVMDLAVRRNAFGRQAQSFETALAVPLLGGEPFPAVFIRAPRIEAVGPGVEVAARLPDGTVVAARQGALLATAFHPELSGDDRFHRLFARLITDGAAAAPGPPADLAPSPPGTWPQS